MRFCSLIMMLFIPLSQGAKERSRVVVQAVAKNPNLAKGRYAEVRIPVAEVANNGNIVLIYQGRAKRADDRSSDHLVAAISKDSGRTWQKKVLFSEEGYDLGDNSIVIDRKTGRIFTFVYCKKQQFIYVSDDHGITWKRLEHDVIQDHQGRPARMRGTTGIQLADSKGTMVVPVIVGNGELGLMTCESGRDKWQISAVHESSKNWNEPTLVELESKVKGESRILCVTRIHEKGPKSENKRSAVVTFEHKNKKFSFVPNAKTASFFAAKTRCNQHLKRVSGTKVQLLFASTMKGKNRHGGTLSTSLDNGENWTTKTIVPPAEMFAYCSLVNLKDGSLGLFYESKGKAGLRYETIKFMRLTNR